VSQASNGAVDRKQVAGAENSTDHNIASTIRMCAMCIQGYPHKQPRVADPGTKSGEGIPLPTFNFPAGILSPYQIF